jgi:hypothetical protein
MKKLINVAFVFAVVSTCLALVYGCGAPESPVVITKSVKYHDPILDYDFTPTVHEIPPRYTRDGVVNPFMNKPKVVVKVVKKIAVPRTQLTRWILPKLQLTSVVITSKSSFAFFTGPGDGRTYKGISGDFIGRSGATILDITSGTVHLSTGLKLVVNK